MIYFWPIRDILTYMARDGKIDGKYINKKVGWNWKEINKIELETENKLEWKVNMKSLEKFTEDLIKIRNYRIYYTDRVKATDETVKTIEQMINNEDWTMNDRDGYMKIKDLWNEYKTNCIKIKNLEFRICSTAEETFCEIPIVFEEDNDLFETKPCNPFEMKKLEEKWTHLEEDIKVNRKRKRKKTTKENRMVEAKRIRLGNEQMLEKMKEIKKILLFMKEKKENTNEELVLDKADQIYDINRTVYDEEVKDVFRQIVLSRKDNLDMPYKILEEELLTGRNFTLRMPKMDNIRNNLLGMLQEINEIETKDWEDETLADRLQIITANRFKTVININMKNIMMELVNYKKELEMVNEIKNDCEDKNGIDIQKLMMLMYNLNGEANYENKRLHYIERWLEEIEKNIERGMKKRRMITKEDNENRNRKMNTEKVSCRYSETTKRTEKSKKQI